MESQELTFCKCLRRPETTPAQSTRDSEKGQNYLFAGSDAGAERAATLYSILRTCALHGIDGYAYLVDVLGKLAAGWLYSRLDELLPANWANWEAASRAASAADPAEELALAKVG